MKRKRFYGFTIIEAIMAITFLFLITGSIFSCFLSVQRFFLHTSELAHIQGISQTVMSKIVRPTREAVSFTITGGGTVLTITHVDGSTEVFSFNNGDGVDATEVDNTIEHDGVAVGTHIVKIPGLFVFQELEVDERVGINFGVRFEGMNDWLREIRISNQVYLRN